MDTLITVIGLAGIAFGLFMTVYYLGELLGFIFRPNAHREFKKLKTEYKKGHARALYYPYGSACHTRCDFNYSSGGFSTTLDPVSSPFGVYDCIEFNIPKLSEKDKKWLVKKAHNWAQKHIKTK